MKPKILKLNTMWLLLLFVFVGVSCQKDEIQLADENIEINSMPGISIYRTKGDYTDKLKVCLDSFGNITCTPLFGNDPLIVKEGEDGKFLLKRRYFLKSDYIIEDIFLDYAFVDITITEMVDKFESEGAGYWTHDKYESRIIDRDPFVEFYYYDGMETPLKTFTVGEINEMIDNGTLEETFTKLK